MRTVVCCILLLLLVCTLSNANVPNGIIEVDSSTFSKVVDGSKYVLAEFVQASWKETLDFPKVGEAFIGNDEVLVVKVDTSFDEKLKERFGITELPAVRFFPKSLTPLIYKGPFGAQEIIDFTRLQIVPQLQSLKGIVDTFLTSDEKELLIEKSIALVKDFTGVDLSYANVLLSHMRFIAKKGEPYIQAERKRLRGLIGNKKSASESKLAEFKRRLSTLSLFVSDTQEVLDDLVPKDAAPKDTIPKDTAPKVAVGDATPKDEL